jgi:hypothetical protein
VGANDAALDVLGYTAQELRDLPFGTLSGSSPDVAARVWHGFVESGLTIAPHPDLRLAAKGGMHVAVRFLGTERLDADRWVRRYRLLTGQPVVTDQPFLLQVLLGQWRELERRVATASGDAADRRELEDQLAEVKALYRSEQERRSPRPTT